MLSKYIDRELGLSHSVEKVRRGRRGGGAEREAHSALLGLKKIIGISS